MVRISVQVRGVSSALTASACKSWGGVLSLPDGCGTDTGVAVLILPVLLCGGL